MDVDKKLRELEERIRRLERLAGDYRPPKPDYIKAIGKRIDEKCLPTVED